MSMTDNGSNGSNGVPGERGCAVDVYAKRLRPVISWKYLLRSITNAQRTP